MFVNYSCGHFTSVPLVKGDSRGFVQQDSRPPPSPLLTKEGSKSPGLRRGATHERRLLLTLLPTTLHFFCTLNHFIDSASHIESLLRQIVVLALDDFAEATNGFV